MAAEQRRQWCFVCWDWVTDYRAHSLTPEHHDKAQVAIARMERRNR